MNDRPRFSNFDLTIARAEDGLYPISVQQSLAGETPEPMRIAMPYDDAPMRQWLSHLAEGFTSQDDLLDLGRRLWSYLVPTGRVRDLYQQSLGRAAADGRGLRLRLRISPPELAVLPWEYAYDDDIADFFVLNSRNALVRYHSVPVPPLPISSYAPVPILAVISNPPLTASLATAEAVGSLLRALKSLLEKDQARLDVLFTGPSHEREVIETLTKEQAGTRLLSEPATIDALRNALRRRYRVLHYVGHGGFHEPAGGALFLEDEKGQAARIGETILAQELRASSVAVVVLNACHSAAEGTARSFMGLAPSLIRAGVPAVVAMQYAILEDSAARFSAALYRALADGWPLDAAVTEGRKAIRAPMAEDDMDWGIPVLFMRSPDGVIWQLERTENALAGPSRAGSNEAPAVRAVAGAESVAPIQNITTIGGPESTIEIAGDLVLGSKMQITNSVVQFGGRESLASQGVDRRQLVSVIGTLREELARAVSAGILGEGDALAVRGLVDAAFVEASKPLPDRRQIGLRLSQAKEIVEASNSRAAVATAAIFARAIDAVAQLT